ncbi:hypothetical protein [Sulfurospirillum barnesii]|uniref:Uncharacterized protein n=1 Tax=Sulfurospirillum barnesii (strain ATCC 700032 / DSM 10660 / SES-3) TaxID=760154 RepID=I3Y0Q5_SULBS|nr:hypothetical protein [Sulfurospirillum barnesii]AFL69779.1 hypothetical protein Sulba_2512 [Sulfurospirillum barnesii SES-3]
MAVGPIGSVVYANQMMPAQAAKQMDYQNSVQMQNALAAAMQAEKEDEVQEVRPPEESYKIDPENEHERHKHDQENASSSSKEKPEEAETEEEPEAVPFVTSGHLDIKA